METEFIPLDVFKRVMRLWWLVSLTGVLGGLFGFAFHRLFPPLYDSQVIYHASLDFTQASQFIKPNDLTLSQYDEDLALEAVRAALIEVRPVVLENINKSTRMSWDDFSQNGSIERNHAFWIVHFRNREAKVAQQVLALWTDEATKAMHLYQQDGRMKSYVFFELISQASLPASPVYYRTNQVVLAGGLIGLIAGILLSNLPLPKKR